MRIDWCNKNLKRVEFECIRQYIHFTAGSSKLHSSSRNIMHIKHSSLLNICAIIYIKVFSKDASQKWSKMGRVPWGCNQVGKACGCGTRNRVTCSSYFAILLFEYNLGLLERFVEQLSEPFQQYSWLHDFEAFLPCHGHYILNTCPSTSLHLPHFYAYWYKYPVVIKCCKFHFSWIKIA